MSDKIARVRVQIPRGMKIEELIEKIEITFEMIEPDPNEIKLNNGSCDLVLVSLPPTPTEKKN